MDPATKTVRYVQQYLSNIPAHSWYVLGSLLAASGFVIGVTTLVQRHHLKKTAEHLKNQFVYLNLILWSAVGTLASFVLTNGRDLAPFLPFLGTHIGQVMAIATSAYTFAREAKKWFQARKTDKPSKPDDTSPPPITPEPVANETPKPRPIGDILFS